MGRKLIKVNKNTAIVIEPFKNEYGDYVGIREFWKPRDADEDTEWRPSQRGLSIPVDAEKDTFKKVLKALKWAEENFEEEHKTLESKKKSKKKDEDDSDDEDDEPKSKKKSKKAKKQKDDDDDE